jgi:hypothetical protein
LPKIRQHWPDCGARRISLGQWLRLLRVKERKHHGHAARFRTNDAVFDGTLKQGLSVDLAQSPFLNVLSTKKIRETQRLMAALPMKKSRPMSRAKYASAPEAKRRSADRSRSWEVII